MVLEYNEQGPVWGHYRIFLHQVALASHKGASLRTNCFDLMQISVCALGGSGGWPQTFQPQSCGKLRRFSLIPTSNQLSPSHFGHLRLNCQLEKNICYVFSLCKIFQLRIALGPREVAQWLKSSPHTRPDPMWMLF